ncbi:Holliday junction resolvase RuvX [soil metagenome]
MSDGPAFPAIALDVGDVRIGVAISRSGVIAEPLLTIDRTAGRKQTLDALQALVEQHGAKCCVIGLPLLVGGAEGEQAEKTRAFSRSLARRLPRLSLHFFDERYTSGDARDLIGRRAQSKGEIDRVAAAYILQQFLDHLNEDKKKTEGAGT